MSTIEDRLVRDIAAVTENAAVTEAELEDARGELHERLEVRRLGGRRRILTAVAAAAVAIPALGYAAFTAWDDGPGADGESQPANPAPPTTDPVDTFLSGPAPTPTDLEGLWRVDGGTLLVRFSQPDVIAFDDTGRVLSDPAVTGTYAVDGDLITVRVGQGSQACAGQTFSMRSALPEAGSLMLAHTMSGTGNCSSEEDERWVMEQVVPSAGPLADFELSSEARAGDWAPPSGPRALYGVWMAEGGGAALQLDQQGGYAIADKSGETVDRGRWTLAGSQLVLTSSTTSQTCSAGDRLVWEGLEHFIPDTTVMRGTLQSNDCYVSWASATWILLPDELS